jgi:exodeoxyribonuclease VII large subunit
VKYFNKSKSVDVIIVTRGGGSIEDLAAFNDERLARTIAASELPVISAVGHEIDFTIADFVADLRAPTPSAAAELVIEAKHQIESAVASFSDRLRNAMRYRLIIARQRLEQSGRNAAFERMRHAVQVRQQRVDELGFRLGNAERSVMLKLRQRLEVAQARVRQHDLPRALAAHKSLLEQREQRMRTALERLLTQRRTRLERLQTQLQALSPLRVLDRGYALVFGQDGQLIRTVEGVTEGAVLTTRLSDGELRSTVSETKRSVRK